MAVLATVTAAAAAALVVGGGGVAVEVVFFLSAVAVFVCDFFPSLAVGAGFLPDGFDGSDALVPVFFRRLFPLVLGCSSMMRVVLVGTNKFFFRKLLVPSSSILNSTLEEEVLCLLKYNRQTQNIVPLALTVSIRC